MKRWILGIGLLLAPAIVRAQDVIALPADDWVAAIIKALPLKPHTQVFVLELALVVYVVLGFLQRWIPLNTIVGRIVNAIFTGWRSPSQSTAVLIARIEALERALIRTVPPTTPVVTTPAIAPVPPPKS